MGHLYAVIAHVFGNITGSNRSFSSLCVDWLNVTFDSDDESGTVEDIKERKVCLSANLLISWFILSGINGLMLRLHCR